MLQCRGFPATAGQRKNVRAAEFLLFLDTQGAERRYLLDPGHEITPEKLYERHWAMAALDRALLRLRRESRQLCLAD